MGAYCRDRSVPAPGEHIDDWSFDTGLVVLEFDMMDTILDAGIAWKIVKTTVDLYLEGAVRDESQLRVGWCKAR